MFFIGNWIRIDYRLTSWRSLKLKDNNYLEINKVAIHRSHLDAVATEKEMACTIIDGYFTILQESNPHNTYLDCSNFLFNDHLRPRPVTDMTEKSLIIIPVNLNNHWILWVLNIATCTLYCYCSLGPKRQGSDYEALFRNIYDKLLGWTTLDRIKFVMGACPDQGNTVNCGIHLLKNAEASGVGKTGDLKWSKKGMQEDILEKLYKRGEWKDKRNGEGDVKV